MAEAVEPLERANSLRPNETSLMSTLGLAYFESNNFEKAIDILTKADVLRHDDRIITMFLGVAKARREMLNSFDAIVQKVKLNPDDIEARNILASAYRYEGMLKDAEREYLAVINLTQKDYRGYNQLSVFYGDTGQIEKQLEFERKAAELSQHHVPYLGMGLTLAKLGRLEEAILAMRKSIEIKPTFVEAHLQLGDLLLKTGKRDESLRSYQNAFDLASGAPRPNFRLAWQYIHAGNKEAALRHYGILKGIAPNDVKYLERSLRAHFGKI